MERQSKCTKIKHKSDRKLYNILYKQKQRKMSEFKRIERNAKRVSSESEENILKERTSARLFDIFKIKERDAKRISRESRENKGTKFNFKV